MHKKLKHLFKDLKQIDYVYLRDTSYLEKISSKDDIDLIVKRKDVKKLVKIFWKHNFITFDKYVNSRDMFFYNYKETLPSINLHIDKLVKLPWIEGKKLIKGSINDKGVKILNAKDKLIVLLFKDLFITGIFGNKKISKSKSLEIKELLKNERNLKEVEKFVDYSFTCKEDVMKLIRKNFRLLYTNKNKIKKCFYLKTPLRWTYFFKNIFKLAHQQIANRKSTLIAIVGVDGSGKTTTCNNIIKILKKTRQPHKYTYMGRWGGHVLPVSMIEKKIVRKRKPSIESHKASKFKRVARDSFYAFEYSLRLIKILKIRLRRGFTLTDRYCYDLLFVKKPTKFIKLFVKKFYPKPTLTFVLYNNPNLLFKRKGELNVKELGRQQNILLKLKNIHKIKTEGEEKATLNILKIILMKKNRKLYRFLKSKD